MPENLSALVVDDEPMIRELLSDVLKSRGYEVRTALDGKEGVEIFRSQGFDLIMLDIFMPRMDGLEALKHFRALDAQVGIVLMTGHGGDKERIEGERLGAVFITKPFSIAMLNTMLTVLEADRARRNEAEAATPGSGFGPVASGNDRRRFVRAVVNLSARIAPAEADALAYRECTIVDISLGGGGVQFHIIPSLPPHTEAQIHFTPPTSQENESLSINGTVVWSDSKAGQCGMRFGALTDEQFVALENIIVEALRNGTAELIQGVFGNH